MEVAVSDYPKVDRQDYDEFLASIQAEFDRHEGPLFTTNAQDLFDVFLTQFDEGPQRQHYTCHACRRFVDTFGGLVSISSDGAAVPVMWPKDVPGFYRPAVDACCTAVAGAKVTGVFLSKKDMWGQPETGEWHHMHVNPNGSTFRRITQTAHQAMAEKREDFKTLINGLREFPLEAVVQAITLLKTESLYRSEKCLGIAEWLRDVHEEQNSTKNKQTKRNLLWRTVATAPAGFCHIRSTMIGTLLQDIVDGLSFEATSHRFASKMNPLQYQRPQVLPSRGNVAQAEKIVAELQVAGSLARRFARLDEIQTIWKPAVPEEVQQQGGSVFGHLATRESKPIAAARVPSARITWDKFQRTILPDVQRIAFFVPRGRSHYSALVTAVNPGAPPILQWDFEGNRNPVSWYVYHGGSRPEQWELDPGTWCPVTGICLQPSMWQGDFGHHGASVFFILDGCRDSRNDALGLFPETLKSEFHSIRATIEAYSRNGKLEGAEEASACGIRLQKGAEWDYRFRVNVQGAELEYVIDRWD